MEKIAAIILAAGEGKRMHSGQAKVLHPVAGKPLLSYVLATARATAQGPVIVVTSPRRPEIQQAFAGDRTVLWAKQSQQKGTAHAVSCGVKCLKKFSGPVLILYGDMPLVTRTLVASLCQKMRQDQAALALVTATFPNPTGYGRILRDTGGGVVAIREDKDCSAYERHIAEINVGIYLVQSVFLLRALRTIKRDNRQGEYYLTDLVAAAVAQGLLVTSYQAQDLDDCLGVNDSEAAAQAGHIQFLRNCRTLAEQGVFFVDRHATYLDSGVHIGPGSVVYPQVLIQGNSVVGANCVLESGVILKSSRLSHDVHVKAYSYLEGAEVQDHAVIGPFAHLRPKSQLASHAKVGNFVEIKNATIAHQAKVNHLSYIGDATLGQGVNVGAGTITCNFDGVKKYNTVIGDRAFIGSNTALVAPVKIGKGAIIGAGSVITKDVPAGSLGVSRATQLTVSHYRRRQRRSN